MMRLSRPINLATFRMIRLGERHVEIYPEQPFPARGKSVD
jgi:hypothetical protein